MNLHLERLQCGRDFTIGSLSIDGDWECWTLEDQLRPPGVKVDGQTCIPAGRYLVQLYQSPRFGRLVPMLYGVPMFTDIEIHWGNTVIDTRGCVIVGQERHGQSVAKSRAAFDVLMPKLLAADSRGSPMWITVDNGDQVPPPP